MYFRLYDDRPAAKAACDARRPRGRRVVLAGMATAACLSAHAVSSSTISLREHARVDAAQLRLADIAELSGFPAPLAQSLGEQIVWPAPPPCATVRLARPVVEARLRQLRRLAVGQAGFVGAPQVSVQRSCQHIAGDQVQAVGREAVERWLAPRVVRFEVASTDTTAALDLPAGAVALVARAIAGNEPISHRMQVWVDVSVAGHPVRAIPVAFDVKAWRAAWVATHDAHADEWLAAAALERREIDIALQPVPPLPDVPAEARLRKPLLAGQALSATHVETLPPVQRGSFVTVRSHTGTIGIEARGEALQDGRPGQLVWVRLATSTGPVHARVVSAATVEVEHE